jgi:hypothetical protein
VVGKEFNVALGDGGESGFGQAVHLHVPLVGQHRLDDDAGAARARHPQLVWFFRREQSLRGQIRQDPLPRVEAIKPAIRFRRVVVERGGERQDIERLQLMALAYLIIVEISARA